MTHRTHTSPEAVGSVASSFQSEAPKETRHSRAGGNPDVFSGLEEKRDSRFRGNDGGGSGIDPAALAASIRRHRPGGWTLERMQAFLASLAETGNVDGCCAEAGLSRQSAYALRRRNPAFAREWDAAMAHHRKRLECEMEAGCALDAFPDDTFDDATVTKMSGPELRMRLGRIDGIAAQSLSGAG